jgi:hypothetical protein
MDHRVSGRGDGCDPRPEQEWYFPPVPSGFVDHLSRSFEMAKKGK